MSRLVVISPVHNEAAHIERVARAVAAQTRPPDRWIVVDDGSDDGTAEILASLAEAIPFMEVIAGRGEPVVAGGDPLAAGAAPRAFNRGLASVNRGSFDYIAKLDGDVELPANYFETILLQFAGDDRLGLAGGTLVEPSRGGLKRIRIPRSHVHGALKLYSAACFEAIGGVQGTLAWDTLDQTYARMRGFKTRSFEGAVALHHRPWASAGGRLRGRARHGQCAYIVHYSAWWVLLRSLKLATVKPYFIGGVAFLAGYAHSAASRSVARVPDDEFHRFVRDEHRERVRAALSRVRYGISFSGRAKAERAAPR